MEELCLTLHQPWASLVVYGIKRIEGRNWPTKHKGRLWIHAASKNPEGVPAVEQLYRDIYSAEGIADVKFPEHYPTSVLLGCVDVVGCLSKEELGQVKTLPGSIKLELMSDYGFLCENALLLPTPLRMRGWQGMFHLDPSIAKRALQSVEPISGPKPIRFTDQVPIELPQSRDQPRGMSRNREAPSRSSSRGKENDETGVRNEAAKMETQSGGSNCEPNLPPSAMAARAALAISMGRTQGCKRSSSIREASFWTRDEDRTAARCPASSGDVAGTRGGRWRGGGEAGDGEGAHRGSGGQKKWRSRGGAEASDAGPRSNRSVLGDSPAEGISQGVEVSRTGRGDFTKGLAARREDAESLEQIEFVVSSTGLIEAAVVDREANDPADGLKRFGAELLAEHRPPPLDIGDWPELGGQGGRASESVVSPGSHKRRGERSEELLADGSCGATPWLERVRLGKGPKLDSPREGGEAARAGKVFVPRQLVKRRAGLSKEVS